MSVLAPFTSKETTGDPDVPRIRATSGRSFVRCEAQEASVIAALALSGKRAARQSGAGKLTQILIYAPPNRTFGRFDSADP
jgi:hypothetical protein